MMRPKKMMPRTNGTTSRHLSTIQATFSATASPPRQAPIVTKNAIFLARRLMRIGGLYLTILNETRAKKNAGLRAPFVPIGKAKNGVCWEEVLTYVISSSLPNVDFVKRCHPAKGEIFL